MPKERIYGLPGDNDLCDFDLMIGWEKQSAQHSSDRDGLDGNVTISLADRRSPDRRDEEVYLDRTAINRLVSALRRARSAAFGADE